MSLQATSAEHVRLKQLQEHADEIQETVDLLASLPGKVRHDVMVPFGNVAMFPGAMLASACT
jgi:hypothetical protein